MIHLLDRVFNVDCVKGMGGLPDESVDLVFADPPFNIGCDYDAYDDKKTDAAYCDFCRDWGAQVYRILKPNGSFWLAIGDEYAAELKVLFTRDPRVGSFHLRSWVIWYYTFGVNCAKKFTRSHTHLLYFTKSKNDFTFNADAIKVPSARQAIYGDKRAKKGGRLPDDTWVLRPADAEFDPTCDTWRFSRVCGTFKEREEWHPCQMPVALLHRVVLASSNAGDVVLDPFAGSGTTLAVAKTLGRRFIGFEISPDYVRGIEHRLASLS